MRRQADVESAVREHQRRRFAIALQAFLRRDEHRYARAVFRGVEDLRHFVLVGLERDLWLGEDLGLSRRDVVVIDRRRNIERLEAVEAVIRRLAPKDCRRCAQRRIRDRCRRAFHRGEDLRLRDDIVQSGREQLAADDRNRLDDILAFGYDRLPVLGRRIAQLILTMR